MVEHLTLCLIMLNIYTLASVQLIVWFPKLNVNEFKMCVLEAMDTHIDKDTIISFGSLQKSELQNENASLFFFSNLYELAF